MASLVLHLTLLAIDLVAWIHVIKAAVAFA
jgi:hypothetical protein